MIITSENLALSASDANAPIFGENTIITLLNVAADSTLAGYPTSNLVNPATNLDWRSASAAIQHLIVDNTGGVEAVDFIGIARHNLGSAHCAIEVKLTDPSLAVTTPIASFTPASDAPLILRFPSQLVKTIDIKLTPVAVAPKIAILSAGALLVSQRRVYVGHTPITMGRSTAVTNGMSENGDFLGRIVTQESLSTSISLNNLTPSWYRSKLDPFLKRAIGGAFFFGWRPTSYPLESGYCWLTDDPRPSNALSNGMMSVNISMRGIS